MNIFVKFMAYVRLQEAIRLADNQHRNNGQRFYVMPAADGKLIIMDRKNFRGLKRKHYINGNATQRDLLVECFYFTPTRDGNGAITPEQLRLKTAQYYAWVNATRALNRHRKKPNASRK